MAEDTGLKDETLSVMTAVFNNEVYAKRFKELMDVRTETATLKEAADQANKEAQEALAEARRLQQEAEDAKAGAAALVADFNERNKSLEQSITTHNDTVNAFGAERSQIEQGHRDRQTELDAEAARQNKKASELTILADRLDELKTELEAKEKDLAQRFAFLHVIVENLSGKAPAPAAAAEVQTQ